VSLHTQFLTLSLMAASGVLLGIGFDTIDLLTRQFSLRRWITAIMDLGYWLISTLFVFQVLVYANEGQVRVFIFIGLLVGVVVYYYMFSRIVRVIFQWFLTQLLRLLHMISRIIYTLIIRPVYYVSKLMHIAVGFLIAFSIFLGKFVVQCLTYVYKIIVRRL
jgi:spore cortex biosynthesis protein YabQ